MAKIEKVFTVALSAAGTTDTIPVTENFTEYVYTGTGALVGNIVITTSGSPVVGSTLILNWNCTFSAGGATVTILGEAIPSHLYGKTFIFKGIYNGASWDTNLLVDINQTQVITNTAIVNSIITGSKVTTNTIDTANLTTKANVEQTVIEVSFESGEQCNNTIRMASDFTLNTIYYEVIKALANTDAGTITPEINGVAVTLSSAISIPLSTAINTTASTNCTALNTGVANDLLTFVAAKTTAGGKVRITLKWTRA